jgi:hypothetical protein
MMSQNVATPILMKVIKKYITCLEEEPIKRLFASPTRVQVKIVRNIKALTDLTLSCLKVLSQLVPRD